MKVDAKLDLQRVDDVTPRGSHEGVLQPTQGKSKQWRIAKFVAKLLEEVNLRSERRAESLLQLKLELAGRNPSEIGGSMPHGLAWQGRNEKNRIEF